jgi:hypothetical protein
VSGERLSRISLSGNVCAIVVNRPSISRAMIRGLRSS